MNVATLLQDPRFRLEQREAPPPETLQSFRSSAPDNLPRTYLRFMQACNGAAGPAPFGSGTIDIWPVSDVLERQEALSGAEGLDGYFAFASDESGQLFVFDLRAEDGAAVGLVAPADPAEDGKGHVDVVSGSFSEFLQNLARMPVGL